MNTPNLAHTKRKKSISTNRPQRADVLKSFPFDRLSETRTVTMLHPCEATANQIIPDFSISRRRVNAALCPAKNVSPRPGY